MEALGNHCANSSVGGGRIVFMTHHVVQAARLFSLEKLCLLALSAVFCKLTRFVPTAGSLYFHDQLLRASKGQCVY